MHTLLSRIANEPEKKVISLEMEFSGEGTCVFRAISFEKNKKGIQFEVLKTYPSIAVLKGAWKKETAVVLCISGRGIITKRIEKGDDYKFSLRLVLPNANEEDFYVQAYDAEQYQLVTLVRRSQVDEWLKELSGMGFLFARIQLGMPSAFSLGLILQRENVLLPSGNLVFEEGRLEQVIPSVEAATPLEVDGKQISPSNLLALGNGFSYYLSEEGAMAEQFASANVELAHQGEEELHYRRLLYKVGFGALAILMVVLVFNQLVRNHYEDRYMILEEILAATANERQELAEMKIELQQKQDLVNTTGMNSAARLSFYMDRIGATVPESIVLNDLSVNPLKERKLNAGEKAGFQFGKIYVSGTVRHTEALNAWVEDLKALEWAREVVIDKYNRLEESDNAFFTIHIFTS
jgi:Tfp pilus assembly protein PilN